MENIVQEAISAPVSPAGQAQKCLPPDQPAFLLHHGALSFFFSSLVPFILMHKRENLSCFFSLNISYFYKFACKFKENFQFHIN
jgi:hypothetical protein